MSVHFVNTFYRHVILPKEIAKLVPKTHLMSEAEWRTIGVQQSQGWEHYMMHGPGMIAAYFVFVYMYDEEMFNQNEQYNPEYS